MAISKNLAEDPYERLASGIILQAVSDYRSALRRIKRSPGNRSAIDEAIQIEQFFRSQWFECLTTIDGEFLIRKLRQEI